MTLFQEENDFWDLVEIFEDYSLGHLLKVYEQKYPYHDLEDIKKGLTDFTKAEEVPDPICLRRRTWELVKKRIMEEAKSIC